jgi:hypothetical protein
MFLHRLAYLAKEDDVYSEKIMTVREYAVSRRLKVKSVYAWILRAPVPHNVSGIHAAERRVLQ